MKRINFIFLLLVSMFMTGCGYTTGSLLPSHIKQIYIHPFRNRIELTAELTPDQYRFRSYRPNLETDITEEVIDRFINDGHLKVVEEENADIVLKGELIDYLSQPVRYGADNETIEESRVSLVCFVELRDVKKDTLMWREPRIIGDATYNLSGVYVSSESSAVSAAVSDLARRIVNRTIEGW